MLDVSSLNVHYGQMQAVTDLSISVKEGQVVAVTGSNGSGKTSALNAISGIISPPSYVPLLEVRPCLRQNRWNGRRG